MKTLLTVTILFSGNILCGQNYINYYNLCNEADKQAYLQNDSLALENYEKAFKLVDYVHANQFKKASICAAQINAFEKSTEYAKKAILNGSPPKFLNQKELKKLRKSEPYNLFADSVSVFVTRYESSINKAYKKEIDSLHYVDQRIARNNYSVKGKYTISDSSINQGLWTLDSLVFIRLLSLIHEYGFPSERVIGTDGYRDVSIILHHHLRLPHNSIYLDFAKNALFQGEYLPEDYAWMYDQSLASIGEKPYFHYGIIFTDDLPQNKKIEIDFKREKYGVKPLESTKIKKTKNGIIQKHLW